MVSNLPPPGPQSRVDKLGLWMHARRWRQWLVLGAFAAIAFPTLMAAWIAVAYFRGDTDPSAGAVALNLLAMPMLAVIIFPLTHRAMYRWMWHIDRRRAAALPGTWENPAYGSEQTEPAPSIAWPWRFRARHALMYIGAVGGLLFAFLPYRNQLWFTRFVAQHSVGSASGGSLNSILFAYLPMLGLFCLAMLLTARNIRRRDSGLLDRQRALLLAAEINWLFAFAAALTMTVLFCRLIGGAIVAYL